MYTAVYTLGIPRRYLFCTGGDLSVDAFANGFPRCFSERVAKIVWGLVPATILPALP